jgi:hypothetical protein
MAHVVADVCPDIHEHVDTNDELADHHRLYRLERTVHHVTLTGQPKPKACHLGVYSIESSVSPLPITMGEPWESLGLPL